MTVLNIKEKPFITLNKPQRGYINIAWGSAPGNKKSAIYDGVKYISLGPKKIRFLRFIEIRFLEEIEFLFYQQIVYQFSVYL
jgi:hypothetical protein